MMKYTCFFYPDDKEQTCRIEIPALDCEMTIRPRKWDIPELKRIAGEELSLQVYLLGMDEDRLPPDREDGAEDGYKFACKIEADPESAADRVAVIKEYDVND